MPIFSMTRREARLLGTVMETSWFNPRGPKAWRRTRARAFGGKSEIPVSRGQPPADLDGRHERSLEIRHREPDEPDELAGTQLRRVETESAAIELRYDPVHQCVALGPGKAGRKVAHDAGVAVHAEKGLAVGILPAAKHQPRGLEVHGFHSFTFLTGSFGTWTALTAISQ